MRKTHTRKPADRQRSHYSEQDKIKAVTIVLSYGGMTYEAMEEARRYLNNNKLSYTSMHQWIRRYKDKVLAVTPSLKPSLESTVTETLDVVVQQMLDARTKYLNRLNQDEVVNQTSARDAGVITGILTDKVKDMTGVTPDETAMIRKFRMLGVRSGRDHLAYLQDCYDTWLSHIDNEMATVTIAAHAVSND